MSLIFSVFQKPKNANSFSVSIFQDGTLIHRVFDDTISNKPIIQESKYVLNETTIKKLSKMVKQEFTKMKKYRDTLIGWKSYSETKIQLMTKEFKIEPLLSDLEKPEQNYLAVEQLYRDIAMMLETLEPLCFSYHRFFMVDKSKDINSQIQSIQQDLFSCKDKNVTACILHYFFKTLYWCNQDIYCPAAGEIPLETDGVISFCLAWDNSEKGEFEYKILPFKNFINQIITNRGEAKIAYQSKIDYFWSTDAILDCFYADQMFK